ncbi:ATP-binding cassette domain-containing protein [Deferribacter autotrophicus]|uniref:ATP-binding cassette domain-containing protein n=1 Tax=Deferribacter autotrophicus TaxID=500465 RepID=A0A5A8F335_9BACT|nr:ATP-binding cassette domain-containing protein [Deferribacter autotrophicus]KAA0256855.1 ATP-binding cassette domain-containing protein [Deferribacter autotrophicus]
MTIIETLNVKKNFSGSVALNDINVVIKKNELIGIIGSNGAGKTTFVNIITGYLKPDHGKVLYKKKDITHYNIEYIVKLGIRRSFQISQLFTSLTVLENMLIAEALLNNEKLAFFKLIKNDDRVQKCIVQLENFGLIDYKDHFVSALPQGVRKLLDICMATLGNSEVIILDEPTSGVAADEKIPLMDRIFQVVSNMNSTCLFIEHDMELIERYSKRVIAFHEGRIIADGHKNEVLKDELVRKYVIG